MLNQEPGLDVFLAAKAEEAMLFRTKYLSSLNCIFSSGLGEI